MGNHSRNLRKEYDLTLNLVENHICFLSYYLTCICPYRPLDIDLLDRKALADDTDLRSRKRAASSKVGHGQ